MIYESPKPTRTWTYGLSQILKPLPKFAKRLGAALTAVALFGLGYQFITETAPVLSKVMIWCGGIGAFLTTLFGKK